MRIGFLGSISDNIYLFRRPVMKALQKQGHTIYVIVPDDRYKQELEDDGFIYIQYKMKRHSLNPIMEILSIKDIYRAIKPLKLDILQTATVKPNIYGTLAGSLARIPKIYNLVEGMGSFYTYDTPKAKIVRAIIEMFYKQANKLSDLTIFVNSDDPKLMIERGLIEPSKVKIIRSVGIDTDEYNPKKVNKLKVQEWKDRLSDDGKPIVMMVARAIWHKGIKEFYQAAKILKDKAHFVLVGDTDEGNPTCADPEFLRSGDVNWIGRQSDMVTLTAVSDIYVLPTSYREGVPRTLLEAASMGKPLVATNVVGCKEVVDDGINGFLVPQKDIQALVRAIDKLIDDKTLREKFGQASRKKAIEEFDMPKIIEQYLPLYVKD